MTYQRIHLETVDSTNEEAKRLLLNGALTGPTCITADTQTDGKGTQGRVWVSPEHAGIYMSWVQPADLDSPLPITSDYTMASGVACAQAFEEALGLSIQLKPINDLYFDGKKLGGILTESLIQNGEMKALITGIGINVRAVSRPVGNSPVQAISLEEILTPFQFERFEPNEFIALLIQQLTHWHRKVSTNASEIPESFERFRLITC